MMIDSPPTQNPFDVSPDRSKLPNQRPNKSSALGLLSGGLGAGILGAGGSIPQSVGGLMGAAGSIGAAGTSLPQAQVDPRGPQPTTMNPSAAPNAEGSSGLAGLLGGAGIAGSTLPSQAAQSTAPPVEAPDNSMLIQALLSRMGNAPMQISPNRMPQLGTM